MNRLHLMCMHAGRLAGWMSEMTALRFPGILLLAGALGLTGCMRYQQAPLYQLDSGEIRVPAAEQGIAVLLGPVAVADYLQREALLQRQADGSLTATEDARWAGSLAADIDQQLLRQLASRLNSQRLVLAPAGALAVLISVLWPGEPRVYASPLAPLHFALGVGSYGLLGAAVLVAAGIVLINRRG